MVNRDELYQAMKDRAQAQGEVDKHNANVDRAKRQLDAALADLDGAKNELDLHDKRVDMALDGKTVHPRPVRVYG